MAQKKYTYQEAFSRLEKIQTSIESNQLDVDELSEKLKEASSLLKICKEKLYLADEDIQKIFEELE